MSVRPPPSTTVLRPTTEHARLGMDSIAVLALYVFGVIGLVVLPQ